MIYGYGDNGDDNDWRRQSWRWNAAMEHACMSLVLNTNRKEFKEAYIVGHQKRVW